MAIERHQASGLYPPLRLPSFDAPPPSPEMPKEPPGEAQNTALRPPSAAEIEAIIEQAQQEGYREGFETGKKEGFASGFEIGKAQGHAEGFAAGQAEGKAAGFAAGREEGFATGWEEGKTQAWQEHAPQWQENVQKLQRLLAALEANYRTLPEQLGPAVVSLSIEIARAVLQQELGESASRHTQLLVERLLRETTVRPLTVRLHPEDLTLVSEAVQISDGVTLQPDPSIEPGSVLIEHPDLAIDAQLSTRWRRVVHQLLPEAAKWNEQP